jgi:hypothetical protein
MDDERPTLNDPAEYAFIKRMYFDDDNLINEELDQAEALERLEALSRNTENYSR